MRYKDKFIGMLLDWTSTLSMLSALPAYRYCFLINSAVAIVGGRLVQAYYHHKTWDVGDNKVSIKSSMIDVLNYLVLAVPAIGSVAYMHASIGSLASYQILDDRAKWMNHLFLERKLTNIMLFGVAKSLVSLCDYMQRRDYKTPRVKSIWPDMAAVSTSTFFAFIMPAFFANYSVTLGYSTLIAGMVRQVFQYKLAANESEHSSNRNAFLANAVQAICYAVKAVLLSASLGFFAPHFVSAVLNANGFFSWQRMLVAMVASLVVSLNTMVLWRQGVSSIRRQTSAFFNIEHPVGYEGDPHEYEYMFVDGDELNESETKPLLKRSAAIKHREPKTFEEINLALAEVESEKTSVNAELADLQQRYDAVVLSFRRNLYGDVPSKLLKNERKKLEARLKILSGKEAMLRALWYKKLAPTLSSTA